jgi:hypothetical protein
MSAYGRLLRRLEQPGSTSFSLYSICLVGCSKVVDSLRLFVHLDPSFLLDSDQAYLTLIMIHTRSTVY